jgi:hypothetical protein
MPIRGPGAYSFLFGDGHDGDVVLTGSISLSRDMYYNNLTLSGTSTVTPVLNTNSCRVFVRSKLTFMTTGSIRCDGTSGSDAGDRSGSAGFPGTTPYPPFRTVFNRYDALYNVLMPYSASFLAYGVAGSGTLTGSAGNAFQLTASLGIFFGGSGGNGGSSLSGSGGTGSLTTGLNVYGPFTSSSVDYASAILGYVIGVTSSEDAGWTYGVVTPIGGGGGGGAGCGLSGSTRVGPGGGGGGGVLLVTATEVVCGLSSTFVLTGSTTTYVPNVTGTLTAVGGRGGSWGTVSGSGAGGGGGGGVVFFVTAKRPIVSGAFGLMSASHSGSGFILTDVSGGNAGTNGPINSYSNSSAGSAGTVFVLDVF